MDDRSLAREIVRLAVPAFLALIAEPLFLLADSAIIGHLGTVALAGLGLASAVLLTVVGVFVFLAYGTTAVVARQLGAGSRSGALAAGLDGTWLAIALGALVAVPLALCAEPVCRAFGGSGAALAPAVSYLRVAAIGIPAMLVTLACTGVLRGLQDTRTPLAVSVAGFGANIALNVLFVYGFHWGITGSAVGTVIAQTGMAAWLLAVLVRYAVRTRARVRPHPARVLAAARGGVPLLVRTLALRAVLVLTTWVAARLGVVSLAAYQVSATIWSFLAFALDALAIAAQALTGKALGAGDAAEARELTRLMVRWGLWCGVGLGVLLAVGHRVIPMVFTTDPQVRDAIAVGLLVVALSQPVSGVVFVLDGVLIGAGDARWLAWAMLVVLIVYVPMALAVHWAAPASAPAALGYLWVAFTGFMLARGAALLYRARTDAWLVLGAD